MLFATEIKRMKSLATFYNNVGINLANGLKIS